MSEDTVKFDKAIALFDQANSEDPNTIEIAGNTHPQELIHAQWLTEWVLKLNPNASEPLKLASRCQHICRWQSPRSNYPMDRPGYLKWRSDLKKFHAEKAGELLEKAGYDDQTIKEVQDLNLKKGLKSNPDCQTLEDALCLVFLQYQMETFRHKTTEEKLVSILQKTWKKMSEPGHKAALSLTYSNEASALIKKALG